jgi:hypothetical protein
MIKMSHTQIISLRLLHRRLYNGKNMDFGVRDIGANPNSVFSVICPQHDLNRLVHRKL